MTLHYANKLESSGAILIMRGFTSAGVMSKILIHPTDPFSRSRKLDDLKYALNLYIARCLKMPHRYTQTAKKLIKPRNKFLQLFLKQVKLDLRQTYSLTPN
jgi:HD superfamily phosphodiesterase